MADVIAGVTETVAAALDQVSNIAQTYLQQESKTLSTVTDYSRFAIKGAKSVKLPRLGGFTVDDKDENTAVDAQTSTVAADQLLFDKHKVVQFLLEDIAEQQSMISVAQEYILRASKDMALQIDKDVLDAISAGASTAAPDHSIVMDGASIVKADLLECRKLLQKQFIDPMSTVMFIGPEREEELLSLSDFIDASKYGDRSPIFNGEIGRIYGMRVMLHTYIDTMDSANTSALFYHPSCLGYASQQGVRAQKDKDLANLSDRWSLDTIYGVKSLDSGKRQVRLTVA